MTGGFRGWRVVAGAFALAVFAWGIGFYGPGVYIATLVESRGWTVGLLSAAVTWHFLVAAALVANLPEMHRRFGIAAVTRGGALASAAGLLGWGFGAESWMMFGAATLTGVGWALTSGAAINAMLSPWFDRRRPAALAMAFNGASVGGILMTPFWAWLIAGFGFGSATAVVAALLLAVAWPLAGRVLARAPAEFGQHADGLAAPPEAPARPAPARDRAALLRDPVFRGLSLAFAIGLFAQMGLVTHLVSLLLPALGVRGAGLAMALVTVFALVGRTVTAWVLPAGARRRWAAAATFAVQMAGSLALASAEGSVPLLLAGCALFGMGVGNLLSLPPLIAQAEFPAAEVGRVVALMQAINQALYAFAPAAFGLFRESGGAEAALWVTLALQGLAAVLVLRR
ncbi:MFS transporter [Roseomonas frigidaquae]|uniref:MFS transporter n=1 Tax=Falsiroseomonas frigidaquae TaxID=487318 RepID=A0ABX1EYM4_9PROT|nr:MFS transporter [Falsiroseomonas frigidaquae]NKE45187.1 MFS transporter [Falsiroseomonas frigidaquae]